MELEQDCGSHPFLAWTQILAKTHISPLPFFTPLLGGLFSIVQYSTGCSALFASFSKREDKIRGRNRLMGQNVSLQVSVKRETGVQESLPPLHPAVTQRPPCFCFVQGCGRIPPVQLNLPLGFPEPGMESWPVSGTSGWKSC